MRKQVQSGWVTCRRSPSCGPGFVSFQTPGPWQRAAPRVVAREGGLHVRRRMLGCRREAGALWPLCKRPSPLPPLLSVWPPHSQGSLVYSCLPAHMPGFPPSDSPICGHAPGFKTGGEMGYCTCPSVSSLCVCIFKKIKFFTVLAYKTVSIKLYSQAS